MLDRVGRRAATGELPLEAVDICRELDPAELAVLADTLRRESYVKGTVLFREGDRGECMYLLTRGSVSITIGRHGGRGAKRLVTFAPGVVFGEMAILEGRPRSADATFESDSVVYALSRATLDELSARAPRLVVKIYRALALSLADRVRTTTSELRLLASQ